MKSNRILIVLLFAALFVFIGWVTPMVAYSHAPEGLFIEANEFQADNITTGADEQTICFDRTIHQRSSGTVFVELYLITENGERIEILSDHDEQYFQKGRLIVSEDITLPEDLELGKYRYERVYRMDVYKGSVTRTFSFTSEPFYVTKNDTGEPRC